MGIQKQRMLAGELYIADDPELAADNQRAMALWNASTRRLPANVVAVENPARIIREI